MILLNICLASFQLRTLVVMIVQEKMYNTYTKSNMYLEIAPKKF